jgi:agmatinase
MTPTLRLVGPSFAGFPVAADLDALDADVAVVGVPIVTPYVRALPCTSAAAPLTVRRESQRYGRIEHYDFDFGGPLFGGRDVRCADVGDVVRGQEGFLDYGRLATAAVRAILERGAVPVVLGGDHATTIPVLRAYEGRGPVYLVQIDAHLDWRDDREGLRDGLSSPMRRASEMAWIAGMAQIGLRGQGSARQQEVDAARAYGKSLVVRAEELHEVGMEAVLSRIPDAPAYYLTIDADGLDPSIAPGVTNPTPGGVTYFQMFKLMRGLARKGRLVGVDYVEVMPDIDVAGQTSLFGARILLNFIGVMAHAGQIGDGPAT